MLRDQTSFSPKGRVMGAAKRADAAGGIYHMLNRANRRATLFQKEPDYEAFERTLTEAVDRYKIEFFCYS